MQMPLQISHRRSPPSPRLDTLIREKASELERFYPRITSCHVWLEHPGHHHRRGKGAHFHVRIELSVPGKTLVVSRDPLPHMSSEDVYLATTEAFHEMRRQLQDFVRLRRGDVKTAARSPHARVARLHPEKGFGFLETADGREIYFHRASVLDDGFARLSIGTEVRFSEEPGDEGPQASTVQIVDGTARQEQPPETGH
ncbi:MAG TPA: HPF/RaiA family ribosome-associated protein [Myxococcaceae bacterium]|nr:HPF/RaiA family ribosome-associated protein [Myxococcaceae bacterium]